MITLDYSNLFEIEKKHGLTQKELDTTSKLLPKYLENIAKLDLGFYDVLDDDQVLKDISNFAKKHTDSYKDIVVLGIGGSALGTRCIKDALIHTFEYEKSDVTYPRLHVIDNIDPSLISDLEDIIHLKETLFIVVTKSGGTPETLAQYFYFKDKVEKASLSLKKHFVFITDPEKGYLREVADKENIPSFAIPQNIGGRFSVLTAVGLLPAALIGIDVGHIIAGAKKVREMFLNKDAKHNLPFQLATIQYVLLEKGKVTHVLFPYSEKLNTFSEWYRQLIAESLGKEVNRKGKKVHTGITPVTALGTKDQHSQSQLYNEGPNDKLIIFLDVEHAGPHLPIPSHFVDESNEYLKNISLNTLLRSSRLGTALALTEYQRPNITLNISQITPETLGMLFMLFEGSTAFLGELMNVDAYNQPGVELSKNITKKLLTEAGQ